MQYGPYRHIAEQVKYFRDNAASLVVNEAHAEEDEILRLNLDDQLSAGQDSTGRQIEPEYTEYTKSLKELKGQPTDRVTLYDEGDFYRGFNVERLGNKLYTDSTDKKTEKLVEKYGEEIFGLAPDNLQYFIDDILKPRVVNLFKKIVLG